VAEKTGFCFGVQRAYTLALASTEMKYRALFSWGPLIHNLQVVSFLESRGLKVISELSEVVPASSVVIRSHGASPQIKKELKKRGAQIIDATCPFVKKAQSKLSQLEREGYQVLVFGDPEHPEVQALVGYARSKIEVIQGPSDLASLALRKRVGMVAQTTQREADLREIVGCLLPKANELKVFNTICRSTVDRTEAALKVAREADILFVVGGSDSANTGRLRDTCRKVLQNTYQIEACKEIDPRWLRGKSKIGVTAGASTPEWLVSEVVSWLKEMISEKAPRKTLKVFSTSQELGGTAANDRRDSSYEDRL